MTFDVPIGSLFGDQVLPTCWAGGGLLPGINLNDSVALSDIMEHPAVILPDVKLLLYVFRTDSPNHVDYRNWLQGGVNSETAYGMSAGTFSPAFAGERMPPEIFKTLVRSADYRNWL